VPVLRLNQQPLEAPNRYRIDVVATDIPGIQSLSFSRDITFELTPHDGERIRWYLEDYLQYDEDPAPLIAAGVEVFMAECGEHLFRSIFEGSPESTGLWAWVEPHLPTTRIEITAGIAEATAIPWELIRNPRTRTFLALSASSFVRTQRGAQTALVPMGEPQKVRILLVICRPSGGEDVPFRSVANQLVTRLNEDARDTFDLDVLRPPTYEQLATTLSLANERGEPYHIVHFDGHGTYAGVGPGLGGVLAFEDPANEQNNRYIDGFQLGALLRDTGVRVLVLNACQSAFAEAAAKPREAAAGASREEIEAYGSLAQAVMDAGAAGVVAMRYSVLVVTAVRFMAELYAVLARGRRLGEAVASARRNLHVHADRRIAYEARPLQDWSVPVVWERAPLRLWPEKPDTPSIQIFPGKGTAAKPGALDQSLPARPDFGFYGRDETLYALDRAFDTHRIVLLHAYAGSGKTATAAEFARWYALTGGVEGPVLFTSFERHLPLARVLDKIGVVFSKALETAGVQWDATTDPAERRDIALQVLRQVPVLWIWDNVEPITGFPAGTLSDWTADEQQKLRAFLSDSRDTKAKFLLASRREEQDWLGDLPRRVQVPPMPMQERLQLAGAIAEQRGKRLAELPDLTSLLWFTQGNPLTILVTVGEALRSGVDTKARLDAFVAGLRGGEAQFEDEESEGRSKSLGASLSYGFDTAFNGDERKILALLHLFQGFVDIDALRMMGNPDANWCLDAVRGLTREWGIALLDRTADVGLLNAHGGGYYSIHPALPWYFRTLFEQHFPEDAGTADRARRAFVAVIGELGSFYHTQYTEGHREIVRAIAPEEDNLLAAWRLARRHRWWHDVIATMQGLRTLYDATGRRAAWRRLVDEVVPDFVNPATGSPLPGRFEEWSIVTQYRVILARQERNWAEAERLQRVCVDWDRQRAQPALAIMPDQWDATERNIIRSLAASLHDLAQIQREQGNPICAETYRESLKVAGAIDDAPGQATCAFNLGRVYQDLAALRDLDQAERWFRQSLDLRAPGDTIGRARCLGQLGLIAHARFTNARTTKGPVEELTSHLVEAARLQGEKLRLLPTTATTELAIAHNALGIIYGDAGDTDRALHHYRQGIRYDDAAGNLFGAGQARYNTALTLLDAGRLADARAYADAALANYRTFGDRAADRIQRAERLISHINEQIREKGSRT
jgi:tetratricopeptide (TPR) repeat protein